MREAIIDKSTIGEDEQAVRFAAAFVQDKGFDLPRLNNSFIQGAFFLNPNTWVVMTNDGQSSV